MDNRAIMAYDLYVVTDEQIAHGRTHTEIARESVAGGADVIQIRDKHRGCRDLVVIGREMAGIAHAHGALLIVNDRLDIALACGADGVHLGQGDLRADVARLIAPPGFIIGVSVGSAAEVLLAVADGADYIALSPVFATASKSDAGIGQGLEELRRIRRQVTVPVIAIGGINTSNVQDVISAGADGVAVISAVVGRPDIRKAARELKDLIVRTKAARASVRPKTRRSL